MAIIKSVNLDNTQSSIKFWAPIKSYSACLRCRNPDGVTEEKKEKKKKTRPNTHRARSVKLDSDPAATRYRTPSMNVEIKIFKTTRLIIIKNAVLAINPSLHLLFQTQAPILRKPSLLRTLPSPYHTPRKQYDPRNQPPISHHFVSYSLTLPRSNNLSRPNLTSSIPAHHLRGGTVERRRPPFRVFHSTPLRSGSIQFSSVPISPSPVQSSPSSIQSSFTFQGLIDLHSLTYIAYQCESHPNPPKKKNIPEARRARHGTEKRFAD